MSATQATPGAAVVTRPAVGPVIGDGTSAGSRARGRWRRWRAPLALLAVLAVVGLLAALPEPRTSTQALAPDNPQPDGARAAAQILQRQGVHIVYTRRSADAVAAATAGTTLLITGDSLLSDDQLRALSRTDADVVLLRAGYGLSAFTDAVQPAGGATIDTAPRAAGCDDPDARAAGTATISGDLVASDPSALVCFPPSSGGDTADGQRTGGYVVVTDGARRITALGSAEVVTNAHLADAGNAALALRMLGRHDTLVWYVPSIDDFGGGAASGPGTADLLPPIAGVLALELLLVVAAVAFWRGRRLGRVVAEPLPVVVQAAETTRGRGRLYRRSRSHGHAGAALRAGTAVRAAHRLGVARSAGAPEVIDAIARATGRPAHDVAAVLYGPPPTDDTGLAQLARDLDRLESEVHRS